MNLIDNNFDKSSHRQTVTLKTWICVMRREIRTEEVVMRYSVKKVFVKISQNSQENTCVKVSFLTCQSFFFNKVASPRLATLFKKRIWHRCFPVNFAKFLRTPSFMERLSSGCFWNFYKVRLQKDSARLQKVK